MQNSWNKIKKGYWAGVFLWFFFILGTLFGMPVYTQNELTTKLVTLSKKPAFQKSTGKNQSFYWLDFFFLEDSKKYKISGIDYKYINYSLFVNNIDKGDQVTIKVQGENIYTFEKNGIAYMNFEKARYHKSQNKIFCLGLFMTGLICCIIPLLFTSNPVLIIGAQNIRIRFGWILFISMIVAFIILSKCIGLQYLSSREFIQ